MPIRFTKFRKPINTPLVLMMLVSLVGIFRLTQSAFSAPITSTATSKLTIYQGVATIAPGGAGDSILELGNAGRDIAGTGSIFIRPDFLNNGTANYAQFYKDAGDRVSLRIPGSLTSGAVIRHPVGNLAASAAQAKRYEVARIGYDQVNWSVNTSVFVELRQRSWDAGGYKKYEVRAGYTDDGSYRLVEATGPNASMIEARLQIGSRVQVSAPNIFYLPVYVDVDYYTTWDVTVSHSMNEISGAIPSTSQLRIFENGTAGNAWNQNVASFTENDIVINNFTNKFTGQNTTNEGGEIQLEGAPIGSPDWNFDVYDSDGVAGGSGATDEQLRIHSNGQVKLAITQTNGNVYLPAGQLCFGAVGSTNCSSNWAGAGGPTTLHSVLGQGNTSDRSASLGSFTAPLSKLLVNNATTDAGSSNYAIAAYANSGNSAIFAQQSSSGSSSYAGYFSAKNVVGIANAVQARAGSSTNMQGTGLYAVHPFYYTSGPVTNLSWSRAAVFQGDLDVHQQLVGPTLLNQGDVMKIYADVQPGNDPNVTGFPLHVNNLNSSGFAARFGGASRIDAAPQNCSGVCQFARAPLDVRNTYTSGANISSTAIMATGGVGGSALIAIGTGPGGIGVKGSGATSYAGYFVGSTSFQGNLTIHRSPSPYTHRAITWVQLLRSDARSCATACGGFDRCLLAFRASTGGGTVNPDGDPTGGVCMTGTCSVPSGKTCVPGAPLNTAAGCGFDAVGNPGTCYPNCGVSCNFSSSSLINESALPGGVQNPWPGLKMWHEVLRCICK